MNLFLIFYDMNIREVTKILFEIRDNLIDPK